MPQKRKLALGALHKECNDCGVSKPLLAFSPSRKGLGGRRTRCKECQAKVAAARRAKDPEKYRAQVRAFRARRPERKAIYARKSMYGLREAEYQTLLVAQKGCCAICERPAKLCVDHIHGSDPTIVRGLLCHVCNAYLGVIKDSPRCLFRAINYLRKFSS